MKKAGKAVSCEYCGNYEYDEDDELWYCSVDLDEDEMESFLRGQDFSCPYYQSNDEYSIVRHQM
jgi:hypothetical protein